MAYASRALSKAERQYCATRKELLAVVAFTHHFRPYLLGRTFTVRTDHGSLTWLRNFKEPEGQLARWLEKLQEFDFQIIHRPGKRHCNADALSRLPCRQCGRIFNDNSDTPTAAGGVATISEDPLPSLVQTDRDELRKLQQEDPALGPVIAALESNTLPSPEEEKGRSLECRRLLQLKDQLTLSDDGILRRHYVSLDGKTICKQLVVPQSLRKGILTEVHEGTTSGHLGEERTHGRLKERFYWPGHWNDVRNWCKTCAVCASRKTPAPKTRAPLQTVKVGSPMQLVAVDILGPLPESEGGNLYVLGVADYFTKWVEVFPIPNQEARTVATKLVDEVFCRFSMPEQLHSDQGKQFESKVIEEICKLLHIRKSRTTPYHPQSDGLVERFNRTLLSMLACCVDFVVALQSDVSAIQTWATSNFMLFNESKCKVMHVSRKRSPLSPIIPITLNGSVLETVDTFKYLGLLISSDLSWTNHIENICSKARKLLGLLYRRYYRFSDQNTLLQLYTSLVRPHFEYAAPAWDPHLQRNIQLLERTQKFACRMCTKAWDTGYEELLETLNLPSLSNHRLFLKLCTVFKIIHNLCYFPPDVLLASETRSCSSRSLLLSQPFARTNSYLYSFVPNAVSHWNHLPESVVAKPSLYTFKSALSHHLFDSS